MSEYVRKAEEKEIKKFDEEQTRRSLQNLYSQYSGNLNEIEKQFAITGEELEMLKNIDSEEKHQQELNEAFLKGFTGN